MAGKKGKKFSNQTPEQVISHLCHLLGYDTKYDLSVDPFGVYFVIRECSRQSRGSKKQGSDKRDRIRGEHSSMKPRQIKLSNTKKRINPKIRSVKKGRTVPLKGVTY